VSLPLFASARHFLQLSLKTETRPRLVQGPWCNTPPALKHTVSSSGCGLLPIKATTSPLLKVWRRTRIAPASNPRSEPSRVRSPRVKNTLSQLLNYTRALFKITGCSTEMGLCKRAGFFVMKTELVYKQTVFHEFFKEKIEINSSKV